MPARFHALPLLPLVCLVAHAQEPAPPAALKFHDALLKTPHNPTLFSRFHDAWIDEQPLDSLTAFLKSRAENGAAADMVLLALHQLRRGLEDEALATLSTAIRLRPDDPALLLGRAKILLRRLDFDSARKDLDAVAAAGDEAMAIEAAKLTGKSHLRQGDPAAGAAAWDKLLEKHPGNEDILEDLVELAASSGETSRAADYAERLILATTDPFKKAQRKIRLGELLAESGENEKAVGIWSATLAETGEGSWLESEIIARIAISYRRQDRVDALSGKLAELAAAHPRRLLIHRELAKLEAAEGQLDSAIGRFREVLRRSPGEALLREEFIRLLIDGQRFDDARDELGKMIAISPENPDLHLRMADLAHRRAEADPGRDTASPPPPEILASLEKALALMPPGEASGIRIAGLMIQYGNNPEAEKLLAALAAAPSATSAPAEALAAECARTNRRKEALEILSKVAASPDIDTVLRAASSISSLGEAPASFVILNARLKDFPDQPAYLTALANASLAAKQTAAAIAPTLRLVRLARNPQEILDSTRIALSVITAAEKADSEIASLSARAGLTPPETCLLATLLEAKPDPSAADALFKGTTDPALLRFHASLLSRRGDPHSAIAALHRLSQDKSKPDFLKELSELQLRAGLTGDCLETLAQWQTAAPTAREPWITATRLLRESGRHAEAIETTRRALTRFPGDEDLTASLADLHQSAGDNAEAERIFWKLYDQAPDTAAQSRWAARLSMLARQTGATNELAENLLARARSNPRSTGPVLALVELARSTGDREAMIANLARALFIKPSDTEIRIQLASAHAESGDRDAALAILSEGASNDPAGRVRTALARTYIDGADPLKGLRILRSLAGEKGADPRSVETIVGSLLAKGLVAEAIQYMQESLPGGGDWRTKYLLAVLLCEDGRELEAIPLFIGHLSEEKEIPALAQNPQANHGNYAGRLMPPMYRQNPAVLALSELFQAAQTSSSIRDARQISQNLPFTVARLGTNSLVQLAMIASSGDNIAAVEAIRAANPPRLALTIDLINSRNSGQLDMLALLEKYPEEPGLFDLAWSSGSLQGDMAKRLPLLKRILAATGPDQHSHILLLAAILRLEPDEPRHWDDLIASASVSIRSENPTLVANTAQYLYNILSSPIEKADPRYTSQIKALLLAHALKPNQPPDANGLRLGILAIAGTRDQWITAVNDAIAVFRAAPKPPQSSRPPHSQPIYGGQEMNIAITLPYLSHLFFSSLPPQITNHITGDAPAEGVQNKLIPAAELLGRLDLFDSPLLRAYIAVLSGDENAIAKYLNAPHPESELADFELLRASREISADRKVEALRIYLKLRESKHLPARSKFMVNSMAISIARKLTPEQRAEFGQPLRATLNALIPPPGPYREVSGITAIATEFGFEDIVKSFTPAPPPPPRIVNPAPVRINLPAAITPPAIRTRQLPSHDPIERFREFARLEKNNAAAREFLAWLDGMSRSGSTMDRIPEEILTLLTPAIRAEVLALTDPSPAPGLTKRRRHIAICLALGERDKALAALNSIAKERPFDPTVTCDLAFLLPPAENERAISLLTAAVDSPHLHLAINSAYQRTLGGIPGKEEVLNFITRLTAVLESSDPEKFNQQSLGSLANLANHIFSQGVLPGTSPLITKNPAKNQIAPDPAIVAAARNLALAMLRHPYLAETGFNLINSASWQENPADLDEWARTTMLLTAKLQKDRLRSYYSPPSIPYPGKSAANHLLSRLAAEPPLVLPQTYLDELAGHDPHLAMLLRFHSAPATTESIAKLWDSGAFEPSNSNNFQTLRESAYKHAAAAPGAARFFLSRLTELSKKENANPANPGESRVHHHLIRAVFETCPGLDEKGTGEACAAIIAYLTPGDPKMSGIQKTEAILSNLNAAMNGLTTDPRTTARIIRAFDSRSTPLPENWLRSNLQKMQLLNAEPIIKALDSMGLLAEAATWKPLASHVLAHDYSSPDGGRTVKRTDQLAFIARENYTPFRDKIAKAIEAHKPQTFGSLIAAAHYTSGPERERLAAAAFELAAPVLAKADARRTADFALFLPLLPHSATATLPPGLRAIAEKNRADHAAALAKALEQRLDEAIQNSNNPLDSLGHDSMAELAIVDLPKATALYLKAAGHFVETIHLNQGRTSTPGDWFHYILNQIAENPSSDPETALRFYQAVLSSPIGAHIGISPSQMNSPMLSAVAKSITRKSNNSTSWPNSNSSKAWLAAAAMPREIRHDALAAIACLALNYGSGTSRADALKLYSGIADPEIRSYALAVSAITNWRSETPEVRAESTKPFLALLDLPGLSPSSRTQIALTAAGAHPDILSDPALAKTIAEIFSAHCARDISAVCPIVMNIVRSLGRQTASPDTLPHLRLINKSFWENANSPIPSGHQPINDSYILSLFNTAIKVGDTSSAKRLFPLVQPSLTGNLNFIVSMISDGHFDVAIALLPDDNTPFDLLTTRTPYTPEFHKLIIAFRKSAVDPARLLRLECALLQMKEPGGNLPTLEFTAERREHLIASYKANPPSKDFAKIEILSRLATSSNPNSNILSTELTEIASKIDPSLIIHDWVRAKEKIKENHFSSKWDILCKTAANSLAAGDSAPFVTILSTLPAASISDEKYSIPGLALDRILYYILPATCVAISDGKTTGFSDLIEQLGLIIPTLSKPEIRESYSYKRILATLALCEFLAYWESKPEAFSRVLEQINTRAGHHLRKEFSFPRDSRLFTTMLGNSSYLMEEDKSPSLGNRAFLTALLSHEPVSDLLPAGRDSALTEFISNGMKDDILALANGPQESFSPGGRAILAFTAFNSFENNPPVKRIDFLRTCVANIPPGKSWNHMRSVSKCQLVSEIMQQPGEAAEARKVFDSILPNEIPQDYKSVYEYTREKLSKTAEK